MNSFRKQTITKPSLERAHVPSLMKDGTFRPERLAATEKRITAKKMVLVLFYTKHRYYLQMLSRVCAEGVCFLRNILIYKAICEKMLKKQRAGGGKNFSCKEGLFLAEPGGKLLAAAHAKFFMDGDEGALDRGGGQAKGCGYFRVGFAGEGKAREFAFPLAALPESFPMATARRRMWRTPSR